MTEHTPRRSRIQRWLMRGAVGLGALLLAVVVIVAVGLRTAPVRRLVQSQANAALEGLFRGRIIVDEIRELGWRGIGGVNAHVLDDRGREVIAARGLAAELSLLGLATEFLGGKDRQRVHINRLSADEVLVTLYDDPEAGVSLLTAFDPATPEQPDDGAEGTVDVELSDIALTRVLARGSVGEQPIDADVSDVEASLAFIEGALGAKLSARQIVARSLPSRLDPDLRLDAELEVPRGEDSAVMVTANARGHVAGAPLEVDFTMAGEWLSGQVEAWDIAPEAINERVSGVKMRGPSAIHVAFDGMLSGLAIELDCRNEAVDLDLDGDVALDPDLSADLFATASGVDLSGLLDAPRSDIDTVIRLRVLQEEKAPMLLLHRIRVMQALVAGQPTPEVIADGFVELGDSGTELGGDLRIAETGTLAEGAYTAQLPAAGVSEAAAILDVHLFDPPRLRTIAGVEARGTTHLEVAWRSDETISADVTAAFERVRYQGTALDALKVNAKVGGTTTAPLVDAKLTSAALGGRVNATLTARNGVAGGEIRAQKLHAAALSELLGLPQRAKRGTLDFTLSARRSGEALSGAIDVVANDLEVAGLRHASIDAQVELDPRSRAKAHVAATLGRLGNVTVDARDVVVPQPLDAVALERLLGSLEVKGVVNLDQVSTVLALSDLPVEKLRGRLDFNGAASRQRGQRPSLNMKVQSDGLSFVGKREPHPEYSGTAAAVEKAPSVIRGLDFEVELAAPTDSEQLRVSVELKNRDALLVSVHAEANTSAVMRALEQPATMNHLPITAAIRAPKQELQKLPTIMRPGDFTGSIALNASLSGKVSQPKVVVAIDAERLRTSKESQPLDATVCVSYEKDGGSLEVTAKGGQAHAEVAARWKGDVARIGEMNERESPLRGEVSAKWRDIPTDIVPALTERLVHGKLNGAIELTDWGQEAKLRMQLDSRDLVVDKVPIQNLMVAAATDERRLTSKASIELEGSALEATFESRMTWGKRPLPIVERDARGHLEARKFQLASLSPLVARQVSELAGLLTARADVRITPNDVELSGRADLERGVLQIPALGQRLSDITARVDIGDNRVRLRELTAAGMTGRLSVTGFAEFDGFDVSRAEAELSIADDEKLPLTLEGVAIGDASGRVIAVYVGGADKRNLTVQVPSFMLITPETGGYGLQDLERPSEIRVGVHRADGKFVALPVQPLEPDSEDEAPTDEVPMHIKVELGEIVVERGNTATAQLTGQLDVETGEPMSVTGRIEIKGGELDVQGKRFEIERGVVTFDGDDPSNPTITATARWDSPTDHAIYAEYVGDVETGKIKLHSEPPLTQDEIASLLLFGTLDGTMGTGESNEATMAVSVAGDTVARGLNRALSSFTNLDVSARVDTSTGSPRPELVFQVTPRVSAKVSRAVGVPSAGEAPDRTFLTLELRLRRAWALSAVFGDRGGSALDLIWRHRY